VTELVKKPELGSIADGGDQLYVLDKNGNLMKTLPVGAKPLTAAQRATADREALASNLEVQKFVQKWTTDATENRGLKKGTDEYAFFNAGINMAVSEGLINPVRDSAGAEAAADLVTTFIKNDSRRAFWFDKSVRSSDFTATMNSMGLTEKGGADVKEVINDLLPKPATMDKVTALGVSPAELFSTMARIAKQGIGKGEPPDKVRASLRQALEEDPEGFVRTFVHQ
jgi:hypothetical protein